MKHLLNKGCDTDLYEAILALDEKLDNITTSNLAEGENEGGPTLSTIVDLLMEMQGDDTTILSAPSDYSNRFQKVSTKLTDLKVKTVGLFPAWYSGTEFTYYIACYNALILAALKKLSYSDFSAIVNKYDKSENRDLLSDSYFLRVLDNIYNFLTESTLADDVMSIVYITNGYLRCLKIKNQEAYNVLCSEDMFNDLTK